MITTKENGYWQQLAQEYELTPEQVDACATYAHLLQQWNKRINLTALTDLHDIITYHFADSLALSRFIDMNNISTIADIGAGGGFPGLPLKIRFGHLKLVLIEVIQKKIDFMQTVVDTLDLHDVECISDDWRTFLRKTDKPVDLFVARASLQPKELIRMFKPSSPYKHAQLVYWASRHWQPDAQIKPYIVDEKTYTVGDKKRRCIFFSNTH